MTKKQITNVLADIKNVPALMPDEKGKGFKWELVIRFLYPHSTMEYRPLTQTIAVMAEDTLVTYDRDTKNPLSWMPIAEITAVDSDRVQYFNKSL